MESRDPPEKSPDGSPPGGEERASPIIPAEGLAAIDSTPIKPTSQATLNADPQRTISLRPSRSGIALALTGSGATVIHDLGEFAREVMENGLAETADVESLRGRF